MLATYVPKEVTVVISQKSTGIRERIVGFMDDSFINVESSNDTWTLFNGVDSDVTGGSRVHNSSSAVSITLAVEQTSPSNDVLQVIFNRDNKTYNGLFSIMITDNSGRSKTYCAEAYISKQPSQVFGNGITGIEWVIMGNQSTKYIGGNSSVSQETIDNVSKGGGFIDSQWSL